MWAVRSRPESASRGEAAASQSDVSAGREAGETPSRKHAVVQVPQPAPSSKVDDAGQARIAVSRTSMRQDARTASATAGASTVWCYGDCAPARGATARHSRFSTVARRRDVRRMQRLEERDERRDLRGIEVLAVRRHVAPSLDHLPNQLIPREPDRHLVERRPTGAAFVSERMAVPALFGLEDRRSLPRQRGLSLDELIGHRSSAPGLHDR